MKKLQSYKNLTKQQYRSRTDKLSCLKVNDNFDQIGKDNFTKLALSALDLFYSNITLNTSIDKHAN